MCSPINTLQDSVCSNTDIFFLSSKYAYSEHLYACVLRTYQYLDASPLSILHSHIYGSLSKSVAGMYMWT